MTSKCPHCGKQKSRPPAPSPPPTPPALYQGSKVQTPKDIQRLIDSVKEENKRLRAAYQAKQARMAQTSRRPPSSLRKRHRVSFHPETTAPPK